MAVFVVKNLSQRLCLVIGISLVRIFEIDEKTGQTVLPIQLAQQSGGGGGSGRRELPSGFGDPDFTEYEFTDRIPDCTWESGSGLRECLKAREDGRQFISRQWEAKRKAYVEIERPTRHGPIVMHLFIEPDASGRWRIIRGIRDQDNHLPHAFGVGYRRATAEERGIESSRRMLTLLDADGEEIDSY